MKDFSAQKVIDLIENVIKRETGNPIGLHEPYFLETNAK